MLVDLKRTVSYICPMCSNIASKYISVFNFSGAVKVKLICPTHGCHEECVTITPKNNKYRLDIECPLCGETHSYTASQGSFWHKNLLAYKCPAAGMDIFFLGGSQEVQQAMEDNTDAYSDALADGWKEFTEEIGGWQGGEEFNLMFEIVDRLQELKNAGRFHCRCGSDKIETIADGAGLILRCTSCGRTKPLEVNDETLTRLLNTTQLIIGD